MDTFSHPLISFSKEEQLYYKDVHVELFKKWKSGKKKQ